MNKLIHKKITVSVKTNKPENKIEEITDSLYEVTLKSSPINGKANKELIEVMSNYLKVAKSQIEIKAGKTSKTKVLAIYG
jgi:hypothetical protein